MSTDLYLPSLPTLERQFATSAGAAQLTLSAFFIGFAFGQAFYGPLSDRFGRRPPLYLGLALYIAASIGCALAASIEVLVAWRFVQAIGGCSGIVIARAVVRDIYDHHELARMYSLLMLIMGAAPILAPLLGGLLLVAVGWRAIFWVLVGFGAVCLAAAALRLPETLHASARHGDLGAALRGYARILRHRRFLGYTLAGGLGQGGMFAYISGSPFVFIEVFGVPPQSYGWLFGSNALGMIAASQINRRLIRRLGSDRLLARAVAANAGFGAAVLLAATTGIFGLPGILVPLFCFVATLGFAFPNALTGAMTPFPANAGSASALFGTVQFVIAAAVGAIVGQLHDGTAVPMAAAIAVCALAAFGVQRILVAR